MQVFRERQFEIANMENTGFGDSRDVIPNLTPTYRYVNEKLVKDYAEFPSFRRTASGMNSTAEDLARSRGCTDVSLDTFEYQARPFYEKLGYELFGTLDGYPPGYRQFYLRKRLT